MLKWMPEFVREMEKISASLANMSKKDLLKKKKYDQFQQEPISVYAQMPSD